MSNSGVVLESSNICSICKKPVPRTVIVVFMYISARAASRLVWLVSSAIVPLFWVVLRNRVFEGLPGHFFRAFLAFFLISSILREIESAWRDSYLPKQAQQCKCTETPAISWVETGSFIVQFGGLVLTPVVAAATLQS